MDGVREHSGQSMVALAVRLWPQSGYNTRLKTLLDESLVSITCADQDVLVLVLGYDDGVISGERLQNGRHR